MSGPPPPRINTQDVQGQDVVSESSDDHFSSASEGTPNPNRLSAENPGSPIPITRVERVDDSAAHGEVPGTPAYEMRMRDAVPDEIEIVPEGKRSRSATASRSRSASHLSADSRPQTPGGSPVPRTVVERVGDKQHYGEVEGTVAHQQRMMDAKPDEVRKAPPEAVDGSGQSHTESSAGGPDVEQDPDDRQAWFRSMWEGKSKDEPPPQEESSNDADDDDDFGDDFDEFAEGGGDDDFGDFDEATPTPAAPESEPQPTAPSISVLAGLPPLDLKLDLSASELQDLTTPYLDAIFPDSATPPSSIPPLDMSNSSPFLSDRSLSLWQQLVQPPPMQPPNWTRSKIRRLFLVSLGVPVDLDEILPPSKQKRLVLPNINLTSPRASTNALDRIKQGDANDSSTSIDSKTGAPKRPKRQGTAKGPPPPPDFDANSAMLICRTTEEAMKGFTDAELKDHVFTLEILNKKASTVLEYWLQRKDDALKEKEALEGVIENLVGFVKGRRGK
ncbi:hypothetical protein PRZ48_004962 [Zasmidium cellare]|uniref:Uncharacterized protein n=1 Tax=Zasmidium cellare TaxID=395010 RepID=A0ABR0ER12_ZASCE|nr:hypothetical protein PRZ48_004962 [Zasmidium cellare]